ncbi:MAG TPA: hypothetical protein VF185_04675 [Patescibacteria group bacterium]
MANTAVGTASRGFEIHIGGLTIVPQLWQAIAIVILLFLLVLTFAQMRRHYLHWSFKGASFGIALGFFLALIIEGFFLLAGNTFLTGVLGWKNAPGAIQTVLNNGNEKLRQTLGVSATPCPSK